MSSRSPVSQAGSDALLPCVYTFSKDYDSADPYFPTISENRSVRLDSTFQPDPPQGWFGFGNTSGYNPPFLALDYFQTAPWFYLAIDPEADHFDVQNLGTRRKANALVNPLGLLESGALTLNLSTSMQSFQGVLLNLVTSAANDSGWNGLLGNIATSVFANISVDASEYRDFLNNSNSPNTALTDLTFANISQTGFDLTAVQPLPWFNESTTVADNDLDDQISEALLATISQLTNVNTTGGITISFRSWSINSFPAVAMSIQVVSNMPWGNLRFRKAGNGIYDYMIQAGTDARLLNIPSYPSEGLRRMAFQTMLSQAACSYPFVLT